MADDDEVTPRPAPRKAQVALAGMMTVFGDMLEGRAHRKDEIPYEVDADGEPEDDPFELYLNPDIPAASLAVVRPGRLRP